MKIKNIYIILFGIICLGALSRFYQLGEKSLWTDELVTVTNSAKIVNLTTFLAHTPEDDLPKFYSLLLKFWISMGTSEFFMRSLSVIFGILSILAVYFLSRLFFDQRVSLTAAFFTAFSPFLLLYDREIRVYSLFTLLSLLSTYFFIRSIRQNKKSLWVIFTIVNILNIYTHTYAFLTIGVQWLYLLIQNRSYRNIIKPWLIVNTVSLLFFMVRILSFIKDIVYFAPWAIPRERFPLVFGKEIVDFFYNFFSFSVGQTILPWNLIVVPALFIIISCFILTFIKKIPLSRERLYLLLLLFLPLAIGILFRISLPRYFMFIAPVFFIFVAAGLWMLPKKAMAVGALVIILVWGYGIRNYYANKEFHFMGNVDPWRQIGTFLKENVGKNETLYCLGLGIVPLRYYYNDPILNLGDPKLVEKLQNLDKSSVKRLWIIFTYQEEYDNWLKICGILDGRGYKVILEEKWGEDPDYKLKRNFFKKNFLPYRIVVQLYERKLGGLHGN